MTIRELDRTTAEQIAAGEVIENPASVIKELVENSLDAGASRIDIETEDGGKKSISVIDNGAGIDRSELPLAFKRFATSKLRSLKDLEEITSLGFRGEALPSIASIARVTLTTRPTNSLAGACIRLAGGELLAIEETGAPEGTAVTVRDLFYNTPGRLKFLRSAQAEQSRIAALITGLSLAHPSTAFRLRGASSLFETTGDGNLLHAIGSSYGSECAAAMLPLEYRDRELGAAVSGYLSSPHLNRATRRQITLVINGRLVRNNLISNALERGYGNLLPGRRYPASVLHLQLPPSALDVNVHPAKTEVRFHQPEKVKELVYRAVRETLQNRLPLPSLQGSSRASRQNTPVLRETAATGIWPESTGFYPLEAPVSGEREAAQTGPEPPEEPPTAPLPGTCRLIGHYMHSYLVAEKEDQLLLIDQHAAHERVIYHRLSIPGEKRNKAVQLTLPQTVDIPPAWREPLQHLSPELAEVGLKMEPFGDNSYIIRAIPFSEQGSLKGEELYTMLEEVVTAEKIPGGKRREQIRKTIACHRAIKARQKLAWPEMIGLLREWENTPDAFYCPHGRPAVISFSSNELARGFLRKEDR